MYEQLSKMTDNTQMEKHTNQDHESDFSFPRLGSFGALLSSESALTYWR